MEFLSGFKIIQLFCTNNQDFKACSTVGIIFIFRSVFICELIQIGFTHIKNNIENIIIANKKFIKTQANNIIDFWK
jgi:hypothetical protein